MIIELTADQLEYLANTAAWLKNEPAKKTGYGEFYLTEVPVSFDGQVFATFRNVDGMWTLKLDEDYWGLPKHKEPVPETTEEQADRLVLANVGTKIQVIKNHRNETSMGLKESKDIIDAAYQRLADQGKIVKDELSSASGTWYGTYKLA